MNGMNSESVDLIYTDPPFNSKRTYAAPIGTKAAGASFKDIWTWNDVDSACLERMYDEYPALVRYIDAVRVIHSKAMASYLTFMAQRIFEMHRILKPTGSFYLHIDSTASHYLKIVCDRIFGKSNFRNELIWCYVGRELSKKKYNQKTDTILYYSKSGKYTFNWEEIGEPLKESSRKALSRFQDDDGRYYVLRYKDGGGFAPADKEDSSEVYRQYVPEKVPPRNWFILDYERKSARTGYPTQKPLALLSRIIKVSSNEKDMVFDPFCGCATACVAAQQLGRQWIGIDIEEKARDIVMERLEDDAGRLFKNFDHFSTPPRRTDIKQVKLGKEAIKDKLHKGQKGKCNGCQNTYLKKDFHIDHMLPKSRGGQDNIENLQLLCGHCNTTKGDRPMAYLTAKINAMLKAKEEISF